MTKKILSRGKIETLNKATIEMGEKPLYKVNEIVEPIWTTEDLLNADPNCKHVVVDALGGGVKCTKCTGWFCF
jgi:hypothetical protein